MKKFSVRDRQRVSIKSATYALSLLFIMGELVRTKKMETKTCSRCKKEKSVTEFWKNSRALDKLYSYCISCQKLSKQVSTARKRGIKIPYTSVTLNKPKVKNTEKYCLRCEQSLSKTEFTYCNKTRDKLYNYCKSCSAKASRTQYNKNSKSQIGIHYYNMLSLYQYYKLTEYDFQELMNSQKGVCKICYVDFGELSRRASVDHCHATGKIRGLLCGNCNTLLGKIEAQEHLLQNIITYLDKG